MARPSCLRLLVHWARRAASRAAWTAGSSRAIRTAMMAMTTSSSISVKPLGRERREDMDEFPLTDDGPPGDEPLSVVRRSHRTVTEIAEQIKRHMEALAPGADALA